MYEGRNREARRRSIEALNYPNLKVIPAEGIDTIDRLVDCVPSNSDMCIFWADDDKPVNPKFIQEMIQPLEASSPGASIHLWSGNALAIPRTSLHHLGRGRLSLTGNSFMKLSLVFLDGSDDGRGFRTHVAFSSTERLAPICAEAFGLPC